MTCTCQACKTRQWVLDWAEGKADRPLDIDIQAALVGLSVELRSARENATTQKVARLALMHEQRQNDEARPHGGEDRAS